jgi:hypothetical protein
MNRIFFTCLCIGFCVMIATAQDSFVVDYCNDGGPISDQGGWWYTYDDSENGGNSVVQPPPGRFMMSKPGFQDKGYAARMSGTVGNKLGWDFVAIGVNLTVATSCPNAKPVDLRAFTKLQFKMKGTLSGGRLVVSLPFTENRCESGAKSPPSLTNWADYEVALNKKVKSDWTTVTLDLRNDFHQPKWAKQDAIVPIEKVLENMKNLNFQFSSPDGDSVEIWLDDMVFTK